MGFSLTVSVRSQRLKDGMHEFLLKKYKPWSEFLDDDEVPDHFQGPFIDDQLDTPGKCCIGFDYEPITGPEREYHFALVRWMALQIGKRRSKFRGEALELNSPVPYVLFDGIEAMPVLLHTEWENSGPDLQAYVCDALGMKVGETLAQEMAWYCLPDDVFGRVSATHHGRPSGEVSQALIHEGLEGAQEILQEIRAEIARLDVLWKDLKITG